MGAIRRHRAVVFIQIDVAGSVAPQPHPHGLAESVIGEEIESAALLVPGNLHGVVILSHIALPNDRCQSKGSRIRGFQFPER